MTVILIAKTETLLDPTNLPGLANESNYAGRLFDDTIGRDPWTDAVATENQETIEFAGRLCYESWHMPNPDTATQSGYIKNIINQGHYSVLEHVSVSFYVEGVSRNLSHELIRHRHLSFSEVSQRYVNMDSARFIYHPGFFGDEFAEATIMNAKSVYQKSVHDSLNVGIKGKKAREAARSVLPGGMETKFVVSGNLRAWRDVLLKRWSSHADAEMQEFAGDIKKVLDKHYPDVFGDITYN